MDSEDAFPTYLLTSLFDTACQCFQLLHEWKEKRGLLASQKRLRELCGQYLEHPKPESTSLLYRSQEGKLHSAFSEFLESGSLSKELQVMKLLRPAIRLMDTLDGQLTQLWNRIEKRHQALEKFTQAMLRTDPSTVRQTVERMQEILHPDKWKSAAKTLCQFFADKKQSLVRVKEEPGTNTPLVVSPSEEQPPFKRGRISTNEMTPTVCSAEEPDAQKHMQRHRKHAASLATVTKAITKVSEFTNQFQSSHFARKNEESTDYDESVVCSHCINRPCRAYANLGKSVCTRCGRSYRMNSQRNSTNGSIATLGYASNAMGGQQTVDDRSSSKSTTSGVSYFRKKLQEVQGKGVHFAFPEEEIREFKKALLRRGITQEALEKFREVPGRFYLIMRTIFDQDKTRKLMREMSNKPFATLYHILGVRAVSFSDQEEATMIHLFEELSPLTLEYATGRSNNYGMQYFMYDFMMRMGRPQWAIYFCQASEFSASDFQRAVSYAYRKLGMEPTNYSSR